MATYNNSVDSPCGAQPSEPSMVDVIEMLTKTTLEIQDTLGISGANVKAENIPVQNRAEAAIRRLVDVNSDLYEIRRVVARLFNS